MNREDNELNESFLKMFHFTIDEAPIAVFWMNRNAGFTYVNNQACRSLGYTREELMALHLSDIDPAYPMEKWDAIWENEGQGESVNTFQLETFHRRKDGSFFPVEIDAKHFWYAKSEFHVAFARDISKRKHEEKALKKYEQIVSVSSDFMSFLDRNYVYQAVNETYLSVFGKTRGEIVGKSVANLLGEEVFQQSLKPKLDQCFQGERVRYQMWMKPRNLDLRFMDIRFDPLRDEDGRISAASVVVRDITEQKRVEDALRKSDRFYSALFDQSAVGVAEINSHTGAYTRINQYYCDMVGYSAEEMLHLDFQSITHPDDLEEDLKNMAQLRAGALETFQMEKRYIHKNGIEVFVRLTVMPLWFQGSAPDYHLAIVEDISERKRAETTLREHQRFQTTLLNNLPGVVYRCRNDENWSMEFISDGVLELTGYSPSDFLEGRVSFGQDVIFPDDRETVWAQVQAALEARRPFQLVYRILTVQGDVKWIWEQGLGIFSEAGVLSALEGFVTDITQRKQAEGALRESEERLRLAIDAANVGLWDWEIGTNRVHYSPEWKSQIGYAVGEITDTFYEWESRLHPEDRERMLNRARTFVDDPQPKYEEEFRFKHRDGSYRWILSQGSLLYDKGGKPIRLMGSHIDITGRKEMEMALSKHRSYLQAIIENTPDAVFAKDLEGHYGLFNTAAGKVIGKSPADVLGRDDFSIFPQALAEAFRDKDREILDKGLTVTFEETVPKTEGENRTFLTTKGPLCDEEGKVFGLYGVSRDISEQKQIEEELRQAKEFSENLIRTANVMILSMDHEGRIDIFNETAEKVTGYSAAEMAGKNWFETLVPKDRYPDVYIEFTRLLAGGVPRTYENLILTKSGEERHIIWENNPIEVNGQVVATISFGNDVTEHKRSEEEKAKLELQLRQAQKMESIGRLAGGVAHDFNNMLSVILGYSELIRGQVSPDDPILGSLIEIEKAADRSKNTTEHLLAFSRKQIVNPQVLDLNDRIQDIQNTLSHLIGEDIELRFHSGDTLWKIFCDASQIDQIIINLAVNARDAMPQGGIFHIETANVVLNEEDCRAHYGFKPGHYVHLCVRDNGIGMDKETLSQIFEPFFTTKEMDKGTGLGLAMVYGAVSQAEGLIGVVSAPEQGTTLNIYFPKIEKSFEIKTESRATPFVPGRGTILLVEDDELVRGMTEAMLKKLGYKVWAANSAKQAQSYCADEGTHLDLLLTDVVMPEMSGTELKNKISEGLPNIKVLYMSGYTSNIVLNRASPTETIHFIQKPFSLSGLAQKIKEAMQEGS